MARHLHVCTHTIILGSGEYSSEASGCPCCRLEWVVGAGPPDFGGRWPRAEALGPKKGHGGRRSDPLGLGGQVTKPEDTKGLVRDLKNVHAIENVGELHALAHASAGSLLGCSTERVMHT